MKTLQQGNKPMYNELFLLTEIEELLNKYYTTNDIMYLNMVEEYTKAAREVLISEK